MLQMPSTQLAHRQHALFYLKRLKEINGIYECGGQQALDAIAQFELDVDNIRKGHNWSAELSTKNKPGYRLAVEYATSGTYIKEILFNSQEQIHWLTVGLKVARILDDELDQAVLQGNLGGMYHYMGDLESAERHYKEHLSLSRRIHYSVGEVNALCNLGILHKDRGEINIAIQYYRESLSKYKKVKPLPKVHCSILGNLGSSYLLLGQFGKSRNYLNKALKVARYMNDIRAEAQVLSNLASIDLERENFEEAMRGYSEAIQLHEKLGNLLGKGIAVGNLGVACFRSEKYDLAIQYYEIALEIQKQFGNIRGEGPILNNLGAAYSAKGDVTRAIDYYNARLSIALNLDDPRGRLTALENLGLAFSDLGNRELSMQYYVQAFKLAKDMNLKDIQTRIQKLLRKSLTFETLLR